MKTARRRDTTDGLGELRQEAAICTACDLYRRATQTVFGEGNPSARIVLVGEQPGNEEDLAGHPFVGPAGRLLDEALTQAGLDRGSLYVTNAVKHFKWKSQGEGKRRIHDKPRQSEIDACKPWFQQEIELHPAVVGGLSRRHGRGVIAGPRRHDQGVAGPGADHAGRGPCTGHGPSVGHPAHARPDRADGGDGAVRRRSQGGGAPGPRLTSNRENT
jgi:uracil-DNA glycosylase family 4